MDRIYSTTTAATSVIFPLAATFFLVACTDGDNVVVKETVPEAVEVDCKTRVGDPETFVILNFDTKNKLPLKYLESVAEKPRAAFVEDILALTSSSDLDNVRQITGADYSRDQWVGRIMETYTWVQEIPKSGVAKSELMYRTYMGCTYQIAYVWSSGEDNIAIFKKFRDLEE